MEGGAAFKGKFKVGRPAALVIYLLPHYAALPVASAMLDVPVASDPLDIVR